MENDKFTSLENSIEMLARLRAGQHDGHRRQTDDDFRGCVKSAVLFLAVGDQSSWNFEMM